MKAEKAYELLQNFTKEGFCEIKQGSENGRLVLSLEYSPTSSEYRKDQIFVAFFQAAPEYVRRTKKAAHDKMTDTERRLAAARKEAFIKPDEYDSYKEVRAKIKAEEEDDEWKEKRRKSRSLESQDA